MGWNGQLHEIDIDSKRDRHQDQERETDRIKAGWGESTVFSSLSYFSLFLHVIRSAYFTLSFWFSLLVLVFHGKPEVFNRMVREGVIFCDVVFVGRIHESLCSNIFLKLLPAALFTCHKFLSTRYHFEQAQTSNAKYSQLSIIISRAVALVVVFIYFSYVIAFCYTLPFLTDGCQVWLCPPVCLSLLATPFPSLEAHLCTRCQGR